MSGLHLLRVRGETVVHSVDDGSPAARCGIRPMDVILDVDGVRAEKCSLFGLRRTLCDEGRVVRISAWRGAERIDAKLLLRDWR